MGEVAVDASRPRRKKDPARRAWYARYRQWRFARHYGFVLATASMGAAGERARPGEASAS